MTHTSIPVAGSPIEVVKTEAISPLIDHCYIKVCYVGEDPNRNGSVITKEVADQMASSLRGCPIVGKYYDDKKDFGGHDQSIEISGNEWQYQQDQCQRSSKKRISKAQCLPEKHHSKQAKNNRRNTGQGFCCKLNQTDKFTGFRIFVQIDRSSHTYRGCDYHSQQNDQDRIYNIAGYTYGTFSNRGNGGQKSPVNAADASDQYIDNNPRKQQNCKGSTKIDQSIQNQIHRSFSSLRKSAFTVIIHFP